MRLPPNPTPTAGEHHASELLLEQIRRRAYELYEERGFEVGHELDDWLTAEAEITENALTAVA